MQFDHPMQLGTEEYFMKQKKPVFNMEHLFNIFYERLSCKNVTFCKIRRISRGGEKVSWIRTMLDYGAEEGSENLCFCRKSFVDVISPKLNLCSSYFLCDILISYDYVIKTQAPNAGKILIESVIVKPTMEGKIVSSIELFL